jgi:predicted glycosyltransferase
VWNALSLPLSGTELLELRRDLLCSAALSFRPDIVLVDHMPHGARGELLPALDALRSTSARLVLGLRDILDAPKVIRRRWRDEGAYAAVEEYYDRVLVYGSRAVFDVAEEYDWKRSAAELLAYCGYVCAPGPVRHPGGIKARCIASALNNGNDSRRRGDTKLVIAMAGGGADAYPLMDAVLNAFPRMCTAARCALLIITGPFMPVAQRRELQDRAHGLAVRVRKSVRDVAGYIAAADVVVGMAGYNTTAEILNVGTPAVLVPRAAPSAEQRMRARLFAERGWVRTVDPDDLSPEVLSATVLDALAAERVPGEGPDLQGLDVAVDHILELLDGGGPQRRDDATPQVVVRR